LAFFIVLVLFGMFYNVHAMDGLNTHELEWSRKPRKRSERRQR
jgi:hypothetical protein